MWDLILYIRQSTANRIPSHYNKVTPHERVIYIMSEVKIPPFESLPLKKDGPMYNAWGLYGADDELGRLNLITPEARQRGRDAIKHGTAINLK